MLQPLTKEHFEAHLGESFAVPGLGSGKLDMKLIEANSLGKHSAQGRQPFSLLFQGPATRRLPQATYRLEHASLGVLEIFIVPIGLREAGLIYEAIFN